VLELLSDTRIDLAASGARHGEGLFETLRVRDGAPLRLPAHLDRLAAGARFLGLEPPPDPEAVLAFLCERRVCAGLDLGVLRLVAVDRGMYAFAQPWEPRRPEWVELDLSLDLRRCSSSPLNRYKTLSRLENRLMAREAAARGLFEVIARNEAGRLTDGSRTTLFAVLDGRLATPPAADGALPGVARRCLLDAGLGAESPLVPGDLERAEALLLTNALQGAVPVHRGPGDRVLAADHPLLARAAALLEAAV
jgi:branched-chain amino acid aminotransferase